MIQEQVSTLKIVNISEPKKDKRGRNYKVVTFAQEVLVGGKTFLTNTRGTRVVWQDWMDSEKKFWKGDLLYTIGEVGSELINFNNTEIGLRNSYNSEKQGRSSYFTKMYGQIVPTTQIALKNDSSFQNLVKIVMDGQPKNLSAFLSAIRLIDPSANYSQVTQFYANLTNLVNENREQILQQETILRNINMEHENLIKKFPGSLYNHYFKRTSFDYVPIYTTKSLEIEKTGVEKDLTIF